jgi:hypothetical protein
MTPSLSLISLGPMLIMICIAAKLEEEDCRDILYFIYLLTSPLYFSPLYFSPPLVILTCYPHNYALAIHLSLHSHQSTAAEL